MYCINCGNELPDGSKFCIKCGTKMPIWGESLEPVPEVKHLEEEKVEEPVKETIEEPVKENPEELVKEEPKKEKPKKEKPVKEKPKKEKPNKGKVSGIIIVILLIVILLSGAFVFLYAYSQDMLLGLNIPEVDNIIERVIPENALIIRKGKIKDGTGGVNTSETVDASMTVDADSSNGSEAGSETEEEEIAGWNRTYKESVSALSSSSKVCLLNLGNDDIPEMIVVDEDKVTIFTCSEDGTEDSISFENALCAINRSQGTVAFSYDTGSGKVFDTVYSIKESKWTEDKKGYIEYSYDTETCEPVFTYFKDESSVEEEDYLAWIDEIYKNTDPVIGLSYTDASEVDFDKLTKADDLNSGSSLSTDIKAEYNCNNGIQVFIAEETGSYDFELKGGACGADGERVIYQTSLYDGDGATLTGSMTLDCGDKVFIIVGGAGEPSPTTEGIANGGFNGGGASYWSGGGGGCTDLYFEGKRVASASGAGGGASVEHGKPGRKSGENKNVCTTKIGAETGSTHKVNSGAGGGAGWVGGKAGSTEKAGFGGVSGYDSTYFSCETDLDGIEQADSNMIDGYVKVTIKR